ncbi:MAG: riboflavin synthase [Thermoleophilaceae bacterium]|nr:riboflavin synthase [Thermoleophilaceae bacterium]
MFTGLIQGTGEVRSAGSRIAVATPLGAQLRPGDSVAVNGVCLTAVDPGAEGFAADVMDETLSRSSLGALGEGDAVNLELPLRAGDPLGGHVVQGHVDGLGEVLDPAPDLRIGAPPDLLRYVVVKGSIAVDGVSLTVGEVDDEAFFVHLIPETLERTTLGALARGDRVNLEVDILAKYVEKLSTPRDVSI